MPTIYKPKKSRPYDSQRKARMKVYNTKLWRDTRKVKMTNNPLCQICEIEGRVTPAQDCHHLRTFTSAQSETERDLLAFDYDNLVNLCDKCHNEIHHGKYKGCVTLDEIKERYEVLRKKLT